MIGPSNGWRAACLALSVGCAFLLGLQWAGGSGARAEGPSTPQPGGGGGGGGATADSDRHMVAVTGTTSSGSAVLYLVDTKLKRLAVYQATGKNIELVAARNIEYDLKLDSYHDASADEVQVRRLRADWLKAQGGKAGNDDAGGDGK
jgi:hypothetical protein